MRVFSILAVCGFAAWPGLSAGSGGAYGRGVSVRAPSLVPDR